MDQLKDTKGMPTYYDGPVGGAVPPPSHFYMYGQYPQSSASSNYVNYMPPYSWPTSAFFPCPPMMIRGDPNGSRMDMGKKKTKFTSFQIAKLKERFSQKNSIRLPERKIFAEAIGLTSDQVKIWFQNRRYNLRKQGKLVEDDDPEEKAEMDLTFNNSGTFSEEDTHNESGSPVSMNSLGSVGNSTFSTSSSNTSVNWVDTRVNDNSRCQGFFNSNGVQTMISDNYQLGHYPHHQQPFVEPQMYSDGIL